MEPTIGRSLQEGFRTASRSWSGMAFFAGSWIAVTLVVVLSILITRPPAEIFEKEAAAPRPAASLPDTAPPLPPAEVGLTEPGTTPADGGDVFHQLESTEPPPAAPADDNAERSRIIEEWFGRAWPMLLISILLFITANVWLNGGQIAYLLKRVTAQQAPVAEFWTTGVRAFGALFGAWCLAVFGVGALALLIFLLAFVMSRIGQAAPSWLTGLFGIVLALALFGGLIWAAVRLVFWFIAIVAEQAGPVAGLKTTLRMTRGRWWRLFGLIAVLMLISFGVSAIFGAVEWAGKAVGGGIGSVIELLSNLAGVVVNLFLGFAVTSALVRYYVDAKSSSGPTASPTPA